LGGSAGNFVVSDKLRRRPDLVEGRAAHLNPASMEFSRGWSLQSRDLRHRVRQVPDSLVEGLGFRE
jgi:hypothetical protein